MKAHPVLPHSPWMAGTTVVFGRHIQQGEQSQDIVGPVLQGSMLQWAEPQKKLGLHGHIQQNADVAVIKYPDKKQQFQATENLINEFKMAGTKNRELHRISKDEQRAMGVSLHHAQLGFSILVQCMCPKAANSDTHSLRLCLSASSKEIKTTPPQTCPQTNLVSTTPH